MRDVDKLNALINPIGYGEQVFLRRPISTGFSDVCHAREQVNFIENIICYRDLSEC